MECGILLRHVHLMMFMLSLSHPVNIHERESNLSDFLERNLILACIWTFTDGDRLLANLVDDRDKYTFLFDTSLNDLNFHSRSLLYEKAETSALIFL